jgi:hypothetical protein
MTILSLSEIYANQFILLHDGLVDKRVQDKVQEIGNEVKQKLGVHIYVFTMQNNNLNMNLPMEKKIKKIREFDKKILSQIDTKQDYIVLVLALQQVYANILSSPKLKDIIDKDDILDGYVIPLLASKDKNTLMAKVSASVLNGYAQIADSLAENKNIKLNSSIGSSGKTAGTIWRVFIYFLVVVGIVSYFFIILRQRKTKI